MIVSYSQNFEDVMLWRALRHVERGYYIDVGANDPVTDSVTRLFYEHQWSGINIEPVTTHWEALKQSRPRDINLCCAVGASIGELSLWQCEVRGWSSADPDVIARHRSRGVAGQFITVPQSTLSQIWERHVRGSVHFLKIDVEGFERQVLEGLDLDRHRPWLVIIEATRPDSIEESHGDWESLLTQARYAPVYFDGINRFYLAQEHSDLTLAFRHPPNVFDGFVKTPEIEGNIWAREISDRAETAIRERSLAEERAAHAEALVMDLRHQLALAERRIAGLSKTGTGRVSQAMRSFAKKLSLGSLVWSDPRLNRLIRATARWIRNSPRIRSMGVKLMTPFPSLKIRIRQMIERTRSAASDEPFVPAVLAHLSPRVRNIYAALRQANQTTHLPADPQSTEPVCFPKRPKLAYVSPLPPVRSGIADYSAECIEALSEYYDIDVVIDQAPLTDESRWINTHCEVRSARWLLDHAEQYDRVLYHLGNSPFHDYMLPLLAQVPGVVVLHDFHLADLLNYHATYGADSTALRRALYLSHGYTALLQQNIIESFNQLSATYPANFEWLQRAHGVIVHSQHAKQLAHFWYGDRFTEKISVIPHLRRPVAPPNRASARQALGIASDAFIICSVGMLGAPKLNHRVVEAWTRSAAGHDASCRLVFVGESCADDYSDQIRSLINRQAARDRIHITGWNSQDRYAQYLSAADLAIQLRAPSRGETSGALLDCMNYGIATIVNNQGSMAELPRDAVWTLEENFKTADLVEAIDTLWQDQSLRDAFAERGRNIVHDHHSPTACGRHYQQVIEQIHASGRFEAAVVRAAASDQPIATLPDSDVIRIAQSAAAQLPPATSARQLFVDVSATCRADLKTGIQRVVRALVWSLLQSPPSGYRIEPVYLTDTGGRWHYRYARHWTAAASGIAPGWMRDDPIDAAQGDVLLIADFLSSMAVAADKAGLFSDLRAVGVGIHFVVYDLLPTQMPQHFPPGSFDFENWLRVIAIRADSAICISKSVADDLQQWVRKFPAVRPEPMRIEWFHLGADLLHSIPTRGLPADAAETLGKVRSAPSFLMVGTIEPRKGYLQCLQAFSQLWNSGLKLNLVIVGQPGWQGLPDSQRRTIPDLVKQISTHPALGTQLFWFDRASDEFLSSVYAESVCLIAASEGEGFGLPLIEAARNGLAIIARDIPVFREVAGGHATYFKGLEPRDLASVIRSWLTDWENRRETKSEGLKWLTWHESTQQLINALHLSAGASGIPPSVTPSEDRSAS